MRQKTHVCPKCGSTKWKLINETDQIDNFISGSEIVSQHTKCIDCHHIGIFPIIDEDKVREFKRRFREPRLT